MQLASGLEEQEKGFAFRQWEYLVLVLHIGCTVQSTLQIFALIGLLCTLIIKFIIWNAYVDNLELMISCHGVDPPNKV
jgi:hypothetical protein